MAGSNPNGPRSLNFEPETLNPKLRTRNSEPVHKKDYKMEWLTKTLKTWPLSLVLFISLALAGCEGTDSREKVDDTVKELSGQKSLERMDQIKKNIGDINKQQTDRLKEPQ